MLIRHLAAATSLAAVLLAGCCHHRPATCATPVPLPPQPCPPAGVPLAPPPGAAAGAIVNPMPNPNFGR